MAAILDEAGLALLDEGAGIIYDEAGAGPAVIFSAVRSRRLWSVVRSRRLWSVVRARNSEGAGMVLTQPAVSTEPVQVQIGALLDGAAYDPTGDAAAMAFVTVPTIGPAAAPASSSPSWVTASWETDSSPVTSYWVTLLVGPNGGVNLTAGSWQVFVRISDSSSGALPILDGPVLVLT